MSAPSHLPGKLHFAEGAADQVIDRARSAELLDELVRALGPLKRVLLVLSDFTRLHSGAGELTSHLY